ncbi:MAG: MFS transporter [Myxococcales bacterium]
MNRVLTWLKSYSKAFWVANGSELFERLAFYGTSSMLVVFLTESRGFEKGEAMRLGGLFGMLVYGLPVFSGFLADLMGYRRALLLAYTLLAAGYLLLANLSGYWPIAGSLLVIAMGASLVKPTITGTVQKTCSEDNRAVGFSVYYMLVNVGGALGPIVAGLVIDGFGPGKNFLVSAASAVVALVLVAALFREPSAAAPVERKSFKGFLKDFLRVVANWRLDALFVLVAGFWALFFALYGPLPLYLTGQLGATKAQVGYVIAVESVTVILLQVVVGNLTRSFAASRAFLLGVLLGAVGLAIMGLYPSILGGRRRDVRAGARRDHVLGALLQVPGRHGATGPGRHVHGLRLPADRAGLLRLRIPR